MNTKIMKEKLARLNKKLNRKKRNMLLLMDNAPCQPSRNADSFSNITIKWHFGTKNSFPLFFVCEKGLVHMVYSRNSTPSALVLS